MIVRFVGGPLDGQTSKNIPEIAEGCGCYLKGDDRRHAYRRSDPAKIGEWSIIAEADETGCPVKMDEVIPFIYVGPEISPWGGKNPVP